MEALQTDRRAASRHRNEGKDKPDSTRAVQQALRIQAGLGSISAVEYLKTRDIDAKVIARVLTSSQVRESDAAISSQT